MNYVKKVTGMICIILIIVVLSACGGGKDDKNEAVVTKKVAKDNEKQPAEQDKKASDGTTNPMDDVEVDKGLFDVVLTLPADFGDEGATQDELDQLAMSEKGFKSIVLNKDGSTTYTMTKEKHKEMVDEFRVSLDTSIQELVEPDSGIVSIEANDNYSEFTIITKNEALNESESYFPMIFSMLSNTFNTINGTDVDNVHVKFINEASGEVISESDSTDPK